MSSPQSLVHSLRIRACLIDAKPTRSLLQIAENMRAVLSARVSRQQVEDALAVCVAFNTTDRLADALDFEMLSPAGFEAAAEYLLKRCYR